MITDNLLSFVPLGSPLSLVGGSGVAIPSTIVDLLGLGVGVAPSNQIWGNTTVFGQADGMGVGNQRPELNVVVGTAATGAAGLTLNVALQCAADQGAAGAYQPSTWYNIGGQDGITISQLAANTVIFRSPWLPPFPANDRPRYLRLLFSPVSSGGAVPSGAFTAGTISSALVVMSRDDQFNKYAAKNYSVS